MIVSSNALRSYLQERVVTELSPNAVFLGRLRDDGSIWGVVGFDNFSEYDCEMFMGGEPGWMSKRLAQAVFFYPFKQLGLKRVSGRVDSNDKRTLAMDKRIGFQVEGCLRSALGDRDIIIVGMLQHECKWIKGI